MTAVGNGQMRLRTNQHYVAATIGDTDAKLLSVAQGPDPMLSTVPE